MSEIQKQKIEDLKKANSKDQLATIIIGLHAQMTADNELLQNTKDALSDSSAKLQNAKKELADAEASLTAIEEATRAGIIMLYPEAQLPSRHATDYWIDPDFRNSDKVSAHERLLLHILREAI